MLTLARPTTPTHSVVSTPNDPLLKGTVADVGLAAALVASSTKHMGRGGKALVATIDLANKTLGYSVAGVAGYQTAETLRQYLKLLHRGGRAVALRGEIPDEIGPSKVERIGYVLACLAPAVLALHGLSSFGSFLTKPAVLNFWRAPITGRYLRVFAYAAAGGDSLWAGLLMTQYCVKVGDMSERLRRLRQKRADLSRSPFSQRNEVVSITDKIEDLRQLRVKEGMKATRYAVNIATNILAVGTANPTVRRLAGVATFLSAGLASGANLFKANVNRVRLERVKERGKSVDKAIAYRDAYRLHLIKGSRYGLDALVAVLALVCARRWLWAPAVMALVSAWYNFFGQTGIALRGQMAEHKTQRLTIPAIKAA